MSIVAKTGFSIGPLGGVEFGQSRVPAPGDIFDTRHRLRPIDSRVYEFIVPSALLPELDRQLACACAGPRAYVAFWHKCHMPRRRPDPLRAGEPPPGPARRSRCVPLALGISGPPVATHRARPSVRQPLGGPGRDTCRGALERGTPRYVKVSL